LIGIHQGSNVGFQPDLREKFHGTILQRNQTEPICCAYPIFLGEQNKERTTQAIPIQGPIIESTEKLKHVMLKGRPKVFVKGGTEAIRTWAGMNVHGKERMSDLRE